MWRRSTLLLLLAGGLMLLVSLYLPWQHASCPSAPYFNTQGGALLGLLNTFSCNAGPGTVRGWSPEAALLALLLAALAGLALVRPGLAQRLPLGVCGLLAGYFGLAAGAGVHSTVHRYDGVNFHVAYGAVLAFAALCLLLFAAATAWSGRWPRRRSASALTGSALTVALLVVLLLPWKHYGDTERIAGIGEPAGAVAAALTVVLLVAWWRDDPGARARRLGLSAAVTLFACGAAAQESFVTRNSAAWAGVGCALALLAVALADALRGPRPALPSWRALATGAAAALFAASLFLPWERECSTGTALSLCVTAHGWTTAGSAAAVLAIALVAVALAPRRLLASPVELAAGLGILVASLGRGLDQGGGEGVTVTLRYGAWIGFACTVVLIVLALAGSRRLRPDRDRVPAGLAPIACCFAYLAAVATMWWFLLPIAQRVFGPFRFIELSWLGVAGALLAIRLLGAWIRRIAGATEDDELVLLPLALLAVTVVELMRVATWGWRWGGGAAVALCLLLALCGWIERSGGIRSVRIPEALRVDRI